MRRWSNFILIGLTATLLGCLPDPLEVDSIPFVKPKIVVSTHLVPNESLLVLLAKTFSALDANDDSDPELVLQQVAVTDAIVTLKGPTETYTLQNFNNGFYGGVNIDFVEGDVYELTAISETLGTVTSQTVVQQFIDFETIEADLAFNGFDDTLVQVTYTANDPPGKNQYVFTVQRIRNENITNNLLDPNAFTRLLTDAEFDGQEFGETFRSWPRNYQPGDTVAITMTNISEAYYKFLKLREDNRFSFTQFLGEPVNYGTNVKNGLGYFNLNQPAVRIIVLE
jgi:hypothetical protein